MANKNQLSLKEFEIFRTEKEKGLLKWFVIFSFLLLIGGLIAQFVDQNILKLGIISWDQFFILAISNTIFFSLIFIVWSRSYLLWLPKYLFAIYVPLLMATLIYFADPAYAKTISSGFLIVITIMGGMFYDLRLCAISALVGSAAYGIVLLYYSITGTPVPPYEIFLNYIFFLLGILSIGFIIERTRSFLTELLEKRRELMKKSEELEEAKEALEVKVKARTRELEELNQSLDEKVKERTHELESSRQQLQERVEELEKFYKLTIGRELKMIELKKEIETLKEEISKFRK